MPRYITDRKAGEASRDYRQCTILLSPELDQALDVEAARLNLTRSAAARLALQAWLEGGSLSGPSRPASAARSASSASSAPPAPPTTKDELRARAARLRARD